MKFTLTVGLVLRHGERTLELKRHLGDDELQFEDVLTGRPRIWKSSEVLKGIFSHRYRVVLGGVVAKTPQSNGVVLDPAATAPAAMDLASLPEKWRQQIERRLAYIKALRAGHISRGQRRRIEAVISIVAQRMGTPAPSASAVMEWSRRYERSEGNPLAVLDRNKLTTRRRRLPVVVEEAIASTLRSEYFTRARLPLRHAHDCLHRELKRLGAEGLVANGTAVSYTTLRRRTEDVDAYRRIAAREGEARARMVCRMSMDGSRASYPMKEVQIDHTPLNWVVVCDQTGLPLGRPLLTVAIDPYSGYVVGFYLSFYGPGITSISGVLRHMLTKQDARNEGCKHDWLARGLPDELVFDNDLAAHGRVFEAISWALRVDVTFCRVRTPWLKPHVERFFATLDSLTLNAGRVRKPVANVLNADPYQDAAITMSNLVKGLTMYLVDVYPFQVNQRKIARPYDLFAEGIERCPPAMFTDNLDELELVTGLSQRVTVNQGGVQLKNLPYGGPELRDLMNREGGRFTTMCKWNPDDLSSIYVQDPRAPLRWVTASCRWQGYAEGLTWNQHRLICAHARKELKRIGAEEQLWEARMRLHDFWQDATRPRKKKESLLAGRAAGVTSASVSGVPLGPARARPQPSQIVAEPQACLEEEVPDFEAFNMV